MANRPRAKKARKAGARKAVAKQPEEPREVVREEPPQVHEREGAVVIKPDDIRPDQTKIFQAALSKLEKMNRVPPGLEIYKYRLPVYNISGKSVRQGAVRFPNVPSAWRYFATGRFTGETVSGDVTPAGKIQNVTYGASAYNTLDVFRNGEAKALDPGEYEPQYVQIPELLIEALRYRPTAGPARRKAWILPYHALLGMLGDNEKVRQHTPYYEKEFFEDLKGSSNIENRYGGSRSKQQAQQP